MKRFFLGSLVLALPLSVSAQGNANSFLAKLPDPPADACGLEGEAHAAYLHQLDVVGAEIEAALAKRRQAQDAHVKQNQARWKQQMGEQALKQAGLTDAQTARVTSGRRMSKAEKQQLADQVLQQRTNISLAEARNLKNMDPAARKAWAQAYAAEAMAVQQAKPPEEQAADQKEQDRLMRLARLTQQQQDMLKQNNAVAETLRAKMLKLDEQAEEAYAQKIPPVDVILERTRQQQRDAEKAEQSERSTDLMREIRRIERQRNELLKSHCTEFTPAYCALVRQYVSWCKTAQDGFIRYEEMENEKFKLQTKSPDNVLIETTGTLGMEEADSCAKLLRTVFKYRLFAPDAEVADEIGAAP